MTLICAAGVAPAPRDRLKLIVGIGEQVLSLWAHALGVLRLLGAVVLNFFELLRHPSRTFSTQRQAAPNAAGAAQALAAAGDAVIEELVAWTAHNVSKPEAK